VRAPAGALRRALSRLPERSRILAAEERLVVPVQVDASNGGRTIIVPGRIVGAPVAADVDTLHVEHGRALGAGDAARPVGELEYHFAKHYGLPASGTIRLTGGRRLRYVGQAQAPEYFVVTAPGADFGAEVQLRRHVRTVEAQRREIGIGMALGVPRRTLALRPLLLGTQIALLGVLLGVPVGIAGNAALGSVMRTTASPSSPPPDAPPRMSSARC
jgi:hypothetical protein